MNKKWCKSERVEVCSKKVERQGREIGECQRREKLEHENREGWEGRSREILQWWSGEEVEWDSNEWKIERKWTQKVERGSGVRKWSRKRREKVEYLNIETSTFLFVILAFVFNLFTSSEKQNVFFHRFKICLGKWQYVISEYWILYIYIYFRVFCFFFGYWNH